GKINLAVVQKRINAGGVPQIQLRQLLRPIRLQEVGKGGARLGIILQMNQLRLDGGGRGLRHWGRRDLLSWQCDGQRYAGHKREGHPPRDPPHHPPRHPRHYRTQSSRHRSVWTQMHISSPWIKTIKTRTIKALQRGFAERVPGSRKISRNGGRNHSAEVVPSIVPS